MIPAGVINTGDYLEIKAKSESSNSTLAEIEDLVKQAKSKSTKLSHFTMIYSELTVISTLIIVLLVYIFTQNIVKALALWIALVPIIFAVLVPIAMTIGISVLSKKGILIKNGQAIEDLNHIDTILFDKTGTLTEQIPQIAQIDAIKPFDENEVLQIAATISKYSEHQIAKAILEKAQEKKVKLFPVKNIKVSKGRGISGESDKGFIASGNIEFINDLNYKINPEIMKAIDSKEIDQGYSASFIFLNKNLAGIFYIIDKPRKEAKETIAKLKAANIHVAMITGDIKVIAEKIGKELSIDKIYSEVPAQDKIKIIHELKKKGKKIIMVGDGINDAPALAEANVGIAMGLQGSELTLKSAQVILLDDNLAKIPVLINTSKKILKIIESNLFIASGIHFIGAFFVLIGQIGIIQSTLIHEFSSAIVLLNTMRIFRLRK